MADPSGTPSSVFKHAINLNRYETGVAKKLMITYNRILVDATKELQSMGDKAYSSSYRAKRLRQIIGSLKTSLDGWAGDATKFMTKDLDELAKIESEFALAQLLQEIPDADGLVRELEISPQFAKAVVTKDPTELNLVTTEAGDALTGKGVYKLTAKQGTPMVLPNGDTVEKAFRGIANTSAQKFRMTVQTGMLTGLSTDKIVRQIIGTQDKFNFEGMEFGRGQKASARAIALAGGKDGTRLANNQIMTLVRTSVNQVSNTASQETYKANSEITKKYRYVATLDSNTTLLCASKDGKLFDYEEGPMPPLHFNCRSTTVPVIDWDGLEKDYGIIAPDKVEGVGQAKRASKDGPVPANEKYGDWLYSKRVKDGRKVLPGVEQVDALGYDKAVYFNRLAARYKDPNKAIVSLVREDGTEKTLVDLRRDYKLKKVDKAIKVATKAIKEKLPSVEQLQVIASAAKIKPQDIQQTFDLMDKMEGVAGENARKLRQFTEKKGVAAIWSTGREATVSRAKSEKGMAFILDNPFLREATKKADKTVFGKEYRDIFAERVSRGGPGYAAKAYFTMYKQSKGVKGFTFREGSNHIVIRRDSKTIGVTKASQLGKIRKSVKDVITKRFEGGRFNLDRSSGGQLRYTEPEITWLTTYIHEMGHQVHFAAKELSYEKFFEGAERIWKPSVYGGSDNLERFAETFVQYVLAPDSLREASPEAYKWVDTAMTKALKAV
jgi:SPP1 gp7 family putative phage head morphogenesis protein